MAGKGVTSLICEKLLSQTSNKAYYNKSIIIILLIILIFECYDILRAYHIF